MSENEFFEALQALTMQASDSGLGTPEIIALLQAEIDAFGTQDEVAIWPELLSASPEPTKE